MQRLYWHAQMTWNSNYKTWDEEERVLVATETEANVCSSLTAGGKHAPALDIDFPAQLDGAMLSLDFPRVRVSDRLSESVHYEDYATLAAELYYAGIITNNSFTSLRRQISELPDAPSPLMASPLELDCPARLVASATAGHHHLYLDIEMRWNKYVDLLNALRRAAIIQQGFYEATVHEGMSFLRVPADAKNANPRLGMESHRPHRQGEAPVRPTRRRNVTAQSPEPGSLAGWDSDSSSSQTG